MSTQPPTDPTDPTATADEDAYLDRLRAVDPAAAAYPDLAALRAIVTARAAAAGEPLAGRDDLAARRRPRLGWPVRAAAAAAVVVVGSGAFVGGYALGDKPAAGAAPAISLGAPATGGAEGSTGVEPGTPVIAIAGGQDEARSSIGGWWGRVAFTSSGLSTARGRAMGWGLDPSAAFSQDAASAAAAALGLQGTVALVNGSWQVGANDGTEPSLTLSPDGQGSLSFSDPTKETWWCPGAWMEQPTPEDEVEAEADATRRAAEDDSCGVRDLGSAPEGDAAVALLRDALDAVGVDSATYEFAAEDWGDPERTYANAYQVVDGQRTGLTWSASLTGAGLASLYGSTASLVPLGEYEVLSPTEAVERLGDPRFGASAGYPMIAEGGGVLEDAVASQIAPAPEPGVESEPTLPPVPLAGQAFSWPVSMVQITQARLGLALVWQQDGSVVVVPSYELTGADGSVWSVIAVRDADLDFAAAS